MIISFFLISLLSFGIGFAVHKHLHLKQLHKHPEPPPLDTPEHVLNYLEACSADQDNSVMNKLFKEFREFSVDFGVGDHAVTKQKQLSAPVVTATTISIVDSKPEWHHNPQVSPPCEEHWKLFLADLDKEPESPAKINVVKHWMLELENNFTFKEMEMILEQFSDSKDRAVVRKIYSTRKKGKKKNG